MMPSKNRSYASSPTLVAVLLVIGLLLAATEVTAATPSTRKGQPLGLYAQRIYQRILALGASLLTFEKELIFRLEKKRPVDLEQAVSRFRSARDQIRRLRRLGVYLKRRLPPGDPYRPKIDSLAARLAYAVEAHRKNMATLKTLAPAEVIEAAQAVGEACEEKDHEEPVQFPVRNMDEQF